MLKAFCPVVVFFTAYIAGIETLSKPVLASITIISLGTAATCSFTPEISYIGILIMFAGELAEAIRTVIVQNMLKNLQFGVIEGMYVCMLCM
jgi:drug/metabolite transporter (DMT)-like permease